MYPPARTDFAGDAYTPANETADGTTWHDRRACHHGRSGVYIYNYYVSPGPIILFHCMLGGCYLYNIIVIRVQNAEILEIL